MDPIEAVEELTRRIERLLADSGNSQSRVDLALAEAREWKEKAQGLEARIAALEAQARTREERMQAAALKVRAVLAQLPEEP